MNIRAIEQNAVVVLGGKVRLSQQHRQNLVNNMTTLSSITNKTIKELIDNAGDSGMRYETYRRIADLYTNRYNSYHLKSTIDRLAQLMGQPTDKALTRLSIADLRNSVLNKKTITYDLNKYSVQILNNQVVLKEKHAS